MKKPQGVYLNEDTHQRVTRLVENALDGHGSLAGFVEYLEQALFNLGDASAALERELAEDEANLSEDEKEIKQQALNAFSEAPIDGFKEDAERFKEYDAAWAGLAKHLPWSVSEAKKHVFALFLLTYEPQLWEHDAAYDQSSSLRWIGYRSVRAHLRELGRRGRIGESNHAVQRAGDASPEEKPFPLLWQGKRLEVLLEEPKAKSTSFYLEPDAHAFTLNIFGRGVFGRIERGLQRILTDPQHHLSLEPEFQFLEHGQALPIYQMLNLQELKFQDIEEFHEFELEDWERFWKYTWPTKQAQAHRVEDQLFGKFSWDYYQGHNYATSIGCYFNSLRLALRLGIMPLDESAHSDFGGHLLTAFLKHYDLAGLAPERRLAYHIIKCSGRLTEHDVFTTNAVDYHLLRLFQSYAFNVLPKKEQETERVHPETLATLSQPWVLATRSTLEAYGNANVTKTPEGTWQVIRGRKVVLELSDRETYHVAKALNTVFPVLPARTRSEEFIEWQERFVEMNPDDVSDVVGEINSGTINWPEVWARVLRKIDPEIKRVSFPLGEDTIQRYLQALDKTKETSLGGAATDPIAAGFMATAALSDEVLETGGIFQKQFLNAADYHIDRYLLTPFKEASLRQMVEAMRGHNPGPINRAATEDGTLLWSYQVDGETYFLRHNYIDSLTALALEYAGLSMNDLKAVRALQANAAVVRRGLANVSKEWLKETQQPFSPEQRERLAAAARLWSSHIAEMQEGKE